MSLGHRRHEAPGAFCTEGDAAGGNFLERTTPKGNFLKKVPLWNPLKNFVTGVIAIRCKATIFKQCEFCLIGRRSLFEKSSAKNFVTGGDGYTS